MIGVDINIKLYRLDELSEAARRKAIEEHRSFELSIMCLDDFISGEPQYDTPEQLRREYLTEFEYYEDNDEPIIENIEANEYLFFEDGELADTVTYCGKSPQSGETHFIFKGNDFLIAKAAPTLERENG